MSRAKIVRSCVGIIAVDLGTWARNNSPELNNINFKKQFIVKIYPNNLRREAPVGFEVNIWKRLVHRLAIPDPLVTPIYAEARNCISTSSSYGPRAARRHSSRCVGFARPSCPFPSNLRFEYYNAPVPFICEVTTRSRKLNAARASTVEREK
jgi:hypothetical protein